MTTAEHFQRHTTLRYVVERDRGDFSNIQGPVNFFDNKATNVTDLKALAAAEIPAVTSYSRKAHLTVSLLLSCDQSIYGKLVEDMGNSYAMG